MQHRPAYPADTATGACFITQDYDPSRGVVDLDLWLDNLPPFGRLCVSPKAVEMMCGVLGIPIVAPEAIAELEAVNDTLRAENQRLRKAITDIFDARANAALEDWMVTR